MEFPFCRKLLRKKIDEIKEKIRVKNEEILKVNDEDVSMFLPKKHTRKSV